MQTLPTALAMFLCVQMAFVPGARASGQNTYCGTRRWETIVEEAAHQAMMAPSFVEAVLLAESAGCEYMNGAPTISPAGAMGLMQLMPGTWTRLQSQLHLGRDPFDPTDNIRAGARFLRELYDQFGLEGAVDAYHSGTGTYAEHLRSRKALSPKNLDYLSRVLANINPCCTDEAIFVQHSSKMEGAIRGRGSFTTAILSNRRWAAEQTSSRTLFISLKRTQHEPVPTLPDGKPILLESGEKPDHSDEHLQDPEAR